jgi:hypothetical protein
LYIIFTFLLQLNYDTLKIIIMKIKINNMTFEHEITFNDDSIQYLTSTTNYLNDDDKQFLTELGVDLTTIKTITTYKL